MLDLNNPPDEEPKEVFIDEDEPFIGQAFCTFQEAYVFYQNYAKKHGFTVRKDRSDKRKDRTLRRDICCHREGKKRLKPVDASKPQRNKPSIKCECNAHMRVTFKRSCDIFPEEWHVTKFVKDHNHELLSPDEMRFLPANRIITPEDEQQILLYKDVGLNIRQIIRVMELQKQVKHGELSYLDRDIRNLFTKVRRTFGDNDAMELIEYMERSKENNMKFQFVYTVDEERRLENLFWSHPQCYDWYEKYGDVVVFDTTYKVNAYEMPCALFVGVNNHGKSVLLGSALLRNETTKTFQWLMKTFVTSMKKTPKTIITDQDRSMSEAIDIEMPTTKHSFCIWHITAKFSSWFVALLRTEYQSWCSDFYRVYRMTTIEEFDHNWPIIVSKYKLQTNSHVQGLYDIRECWAPAYLRNCFFGGMTSTSRSESINSFVKKFVSSRTSLRDFVKQIDLAVEDIVKGEVHDNMLSTIRHASSKPKSPLEKQAYEVLTPFGFKKFQEEFARVNQYSVVRVEGDEFIIRYYDEGDYKYHKVYWDGNIALCSCKNYEFWGFLCRHIFRVLIQKDCFRIPPTYFPLRWCQSSLQDVGEIQNVSNDELLTDHTPTGLESEPNKAKEILCPPKSVTKGRPKKDRRLKGGKELANKKRNRCSICKEVGHTKPSCQNKENIIDASDTQQDKNVPQNKKKKKELDAGLNPVLTTKY